MMAVVSGDITGSSDNNYSGAYFLNNSSLCLLCSPISPKGLKSSGNSRYMCLTPCNLVAEHPVAYNTLIKTLNIPAYITMSVVYVSVSVLH